MYAYEIVFLSFRLAWQSLVSSLKVLLCSLTCSSKPGHILICHVDSRCEIQIETHYCYSIVYTYAVHKSRWGILDLHVVALSRMGDGKRHRIRQLLDPNAGTRRKLHATIMHCASPRTSEHCRIANINRHHHPPLATPL